MAINKNVYVKIEDAHKCKGGFVIEVEEREGYYIRISPDFPGEPSQPKPEESDCDVEVIWF